MVNNQINVVPRWIIYSIDIVICCLSLVVSFLFTYNFNFLQTNHAELGLSLLIIFLVSSMVFHIMKTYTGIISYTSAQDFFRILFAIILINGALFFIDLSFVKVNNQPPIPAAILMVNGLCCFLLMMTYRLFAKYFFLYVKNLNLDVKRVIIYGVGEAGIAAKRTFDHDCTVNKIIVAFVDDDNRKVGNTILGIKIYNSRDLPSLIVKNKLDEIIFASHHIDVVYKNQIVNICLENNIKVLSIPPYEAWENGKLQIAQIQNLNIEDLLNRETIKINGEGIGQELKGKRILITGAAGSIGSEIVRQLLQFETGLIILCDQAESALHELCLQLQDVNLEVNFNTFVGDVKDQARMNYLFETYRPNYVYHAAAYKHVPLMEDNASEAIKNNVGGTKVIADLSVKYAVQKFVMISTDKAVNPTNVMGASKRIAEIYVQSLNKSISKREIYFDNGLSQLNTFRPVTRFITTRFGNVLGSNGSVIPRFKQQIEKGGPVTVTHPEITRYFMTIPEACRLVLEAGCMGKGGEIFVFDMGESVKIDDLAKQMIRLAGLIPNQDIKIEYTGLRPGEKLYEELLNDEENTLPTHHEKIMIGKVREFMFNEVEIQIQELVNHAKQNDNLQVVKCMKDIVQEFKSKNSVYEQLDFMPKAM